MIRLIRTDSNNKDFLSLVAMLDEYLRIIDGDDHAFYAQFNKPDGTYRVIVAYAEGKPVGCGAIKDYSKEEAEIKRMFVSPEFRGRGISRQVLAELEIWASELGFACCILETGKKQTEAIGLYESAGYRVIPNYGQYENTFLSVCMKKVLK